MSQAVPALVDHLFRHASGRVVASLVRRFGPAYLEPAEDAVQESLIRALRVWPYRGVPDDPEAWLRRVALNRMIDGLRRDGRFRAIVERSGADLNGPVAGDGDADLLAMILMCCHPAIPPDAQVVMTLKVVAGFSVPEIARAFLAKEATISQKLSRARRSLREARAGFEYAAGGESRARVDAAGAALYLMFNEGYALTSGDAHISRDLCEEAIRLTRLLVARTGVDRPDIEALLALLLFQAARLPARLCADGEILTLEEQDRSTWDRLLIDEAVELLNRAARGRELTAYHLQAGIASFHSLAPDYAATDWLAILDHYDALLEISSSPLVELNRCVAVGMVRGPAAGLDALDGLLARQVLSDYALLHVTAGDFARQCGDERSAHASYAVARRLAGTEPERRLIARKTALLAALPSGSRRC